MRPARRASPPRHPDPPANPRSTLPYPTCGRLQKPPTGYQSLTRPATGISRPPFASYLPPHLGSKMAKAGRICRLAVVFSSIGGNRLDSGRAPSSAADGLCPVAPRTDHNLGVGLGVETRGTRPPHCQWVRQPWPPLGSVNGHDGFRSSLLPLPRPFGLQRGAGLGFPAVVPSA